MKLNIWIILNVFFQFDSTESNSVVSILKQSETLETNSNSTFSESTKNHHDYLLKINFQLNESNIVSYIRNLIYYQYEMYNITTEDLMELTSVKELELNKSLEILTGLNVSHDAINVGNFKHLLDFTNLTFNDFYERLKNMTNLNGVSLQNALNILNINPGNFSTAVTFGEPNAVYEVLNTGMYTVEKFEEAARAVGTDLSTFFKNVKSIILEQIRTVSLRNFMENLQKFFGRFNKKLYDELWKFLGLNLNDIYRVDNLRRIVENIHNSLNGNLTLGVVIGEHEIGINRKIYDKAVNYREILNIYGESLVFPGVVYNNFSVSGKTGVLNAESTQLPRAVRKFDEKLEENLICTYLYVGEMKIQEENITISNVTQCCVFGKGDAAFHMGNPLICHGKLYGFATEEVEKNLFAFDAFYQNIEEENSSSKDRKSSVTILVLCVILMLSL